MIKLFYEIPYFRIKNKYFFLNEIPILLKNEGGIVGNINYIFCCNDYLLDLNNKYLKKNFYTDVIAFNYSKNKCISGDIFISVEQVLYNSKKWNQLFIFELNKVMIHALLHFLGYNDKKKSDKKIMEKKENFYLNLFK
ncbi:rRNA maturation RNase YbeY [Blattabacterium cuenoti]|uniref:rRNA maturation RNase YbeY n=1 Tax=Blattabacterium cuenoti TaxID=1653831 RepID=UPI00163B754A|nr:rRNA maturation RNase YbeY [Blattabacterium cuenoti]